MKKRMYGRLAAGAIIGALAVSVIVASTLTHPASAQGFFDRLFRPPSGGLFAPPEPQRPVDSSRAPAPAQRKSETPPTTTILVLGDSMADWLAYGLEEALVDAPEIGIVRRHRTGSGLIRYDARNENLEAAQVLKDTLAQEKPNYIVMMIGLNDRQSIRVRQAARATGPQANKPPGADPETDKENPEQPAVVAPDPKSAPGTYPFHTDKWEELYSKRIDDVIAVLKTKNVPVFWVGLPSMRTPTATTEVTYLNELFRARAEKAGIVYVDVWEGFIDEMGRFMLQGPDYEGQNRRLRAGDGVHFTRAGARKLAHYLEREIARVVPLQPASIALPEQQQQTPSTRPGGPTARPLNGPAVPLSLFAYAHVSPGLEGIPSSLRSETPPSTQIAAQVLEKGQILQAPAGRADDFAWPRRGIAPFGTDQIVTTTTMPVPLAQLPPPPPSAEAPTKQAARVPQPGLAPAAPRPTQRPSVFNPFSFLPFFR